MTGPTYTLQEPHWLWGDLSADDESARVAAKVAMNYGGKPDPELVIVHYTGRRYRIVRSEETTLSGEEQPWLARDTPCYRWGVTPETPTTEAAATWAPLGIEHVSLEEITPRTIKKHCGVDELQATVLEQGGIIASMKSRVATLEARMAALESGQNHVSVRSTPLPVGHGLGVR